MMDGYFLKIFAFCIVIQSISSTTIYNLVNGINCGYGVPMFDAVMIQLSSYTTIPANVSCAIGLMNFEKQHLVAVVQDYDTEISQNMSCIANRLEIYDGVKKNITKDPDARISGPNGICGKVPVSTNYVTSSPNITFLFKSYDQPQTGSFHIVVTPFNDAPCNASKEFLCKNGRCIDKVFTCNFDNNCGDNSDESDDTCVTITTSFSLTAGEVVAIVIGILVMVIILPGVLIYLLNRRRRHNYSSV